MQAVLEAIEHETGQSVTEGTLLDDLNLDSLEYLQLILELSAVTGKDAPSTVGDCETVGDLMREFA